MSDNTPEARMQFEQFQNWLGQEIPVSHDEALCDIADLQAKLTAAEQELEALRIEFAKRENSTDWQLGGIAMLRSMKATLQLLREGKWTLEQAEQWVEEQLK